MMKTITTILISAIILILVFAGGALTARYYLEHRRRTTKEEETKLWTCGMHPQVIRDKPGRCPICQMELTPLRGAPKTEGPKEGTGEGASDGGVITIDPVMVQRMGVRVARVEKGPFKTRVRAAGYLREAQPLQHDFSLQVEGWVRKLYANTEGMLLEEGQPLLEVYSPELMAAQEELLAARRALRALPAETDPALRRDSSRLLEVALEKLRHWQVPGEEIQAILDGGRARTRVAFRSPQRGYLMERLVVEGSAVEMGQKLFRIVDHSVLWLEAQIYERDLPFVRVGQEARAHSAAFPGEGWTGRIVLIFPQVDERTRTTAARLEVENPRLDLKPGMYATVEIEAMLAEEAVLAPREAVIDTGERQLAFVALGEGRFEPRDLRVGAENHQGLLAVREGLEPGELVVTSGQFLLDAESRTREAADKYRSDKLLRPPEGHQGHGGHAGARPGPPQSEGAREPLAAVDPEVVKRLAPRVGDLLERYLELSAALSADDAAKSEAAARAVVPSAQALAAEAAGGPAESAAAEAARAVRALPGKDLKERRALFAGLSGAMIRLVERVPPPRKGGDKLHVVHCDMVPADWLQDDDEVKNPYYGSEMLRCGAVVRTLEPPLPDKQPPPGQQPPPDKQPSAKHSEGKQSEGKEPPPGPSAPDEAPGAPPGQPAHPPKHGEPPAERAEAEKP